MPPGVLSGINYLREEGFVLGHGFKGCGPWSLGSVVSGLMCVETEDYCTGEHSVFHLMADRRRGEGGGLET